MNFIAYINSKRPSEPISRLTELSIDEYRYYVDLKRKEKLKTKIPALTKEERDFRASERAAVNRAEKRRIKEEELLNIQRAKDEVVRLKKEASERWKTRREYNSRYSAKERGYMSRANAKGIEYTLTSEQFSTLTSGMCVYCGDTGNTIDRIDSKKGYTPDNSQSCCYTCNLMKYTLSHHKFIQHLQKILNHINRNNYS